MTKEARRGSPFPNGHTREEAKDVGPYPPWDGWKHIIKSRLGIDLKELRNGTEAILKEAYMLRRYIQLGRLEKDSWMEFLDELDKNHPEFMDKADSVNIISLIVERTESELVQSQARRYKKGHRGR